MPMLGVMRTNHANRRDTRALDASARHGGRPGRPPRPLGVAALVVLVVLLAAVQAAAYGPQIFDPPPETDDVRREYLRDALAPVSDLDGFRPTVATAYASGREVLVTTERNDRYAYFVVVPELDGEFPLSSAGTYILRRRRSDGAIDQLKIFLRSDPGFFVRIWPEEAADGSGAAGRAGRRAGDRERSAMSLYLAGEQLHREIRLPVSIETLLEEPFERIVDLTAARVDWSIVYPPTDDPRYRDVALMASRARSTLHTLPDAEDGAMDEEGNLVLIESLVLQDQEPGFNCSGFAKWIIDGLHSGLYGSFLPIEPLKEKHLELRGHRWSEPLEDDRDPYFGLDWTRNLAVAMLSASQGGRDVHPEAADVRSVPYATYVEDVGYPVDRLPRIMYTLAVDEPGHFYVASLSREFGRDPVLHQHVHVAVLFPYFDERGRFFVDVMERNVETSLESLDRRYHDDSIHLVRVRADRSYVPPVIRN